MEPYSPPSQSQLASTQISYQRQVKTQIKHNKSNLALLIILLLVTVASLAIVAVLLAYTEKIKNALLPSNVHIGIWKIFNEDFACQQLQINCASQNKSSPYGRFLWPFLGDRIVPLANEGTYQLLPHVIGAHSMLFTDAILIWGLIPKDHVYWAITGYLFSTPYTGPQPPPKQSLVKNGRLIVQSCFADSISSANTFSTTGQDQYLALVVTPNPNMVSIVQREFYNQFPGASEISVQWKNLFIPTEMYSTDYDYCIFTRVVQTPENDIIPPWNALWVTSSSVQTPMSPVLPSWKTRNIQPSELLMYFCPPNGNGTFDPAVPCPTDLSVTNLNLSANLMLWYNYVNTQIIGHDFKPEDVISIYSGKTVPAFSWLNGMCVQGLGTANCGLLCGCQALQFQFNAIYDNTDTLYYAVYNPDVPEGSSNVIVVPRGYNIVVIAVDHVKTGSVIAYSNLTFTDYTSGASWLSIITGLNSNPQSAQPPPPPTVPIWKLVQTIPDAYFNEQNTTQVQLVERAYVSPSGIGPSFISILPCQVFLVSSTASYPSDYVTNTFPAGGQDYQYPVG